MEKTDVRNMKKHWDTRGRTGAITKNGYRIFSRGSRNTVKKTYEHHLVWEQAYGAIPDGYEIHHKDGNKLNNELSNLQLLTRTEHARLHAINNGLGKDRIGIAPTNKTPAEVIAKIKQMRKAGKLLKEIAKETNLSWPTVQKYAQGVL